MALTRCVTMTPAQLGLPQTGAGVRRHQEAMPPLGSAMEADGWGPAEDSNPEPAG